MLAVVPPLRQDVAEIGVTMNDEKCVALPPSGDASTDDASSMLAAVQGLSSSGALTGREKLLLSQDMTAKGARTFQRNTSTL